MIFSSICFKGTIISCKKKTHDIRQYNSIHDFEGHLTETNTYIISFYPSDIPFSCANDITLIILNSVNPV